MKPTSVIFIITSAILIVVGILTCVIAGFMASAQGVEIFLQHENENKQDVIRYEVTADNINKIDFKLKDASVNVYTSKEDASYIELVNFAINSYSCSTINNVLTIDDTQGIMAILNLTNNGVQFNGLRHYLKLENFIPREKSVNVYLSDKDDILKVFSAYLKNGSISFSDIESDIEFEITSDKGNLKLDHAKLEGGVKATLKKGDFNYSDSVCSAVEVTVESGNATLRGVDDETASYILKAPLGELVINGEKVDNGEYIYTSPLAESNLTVTVGSGNIALN